MGMEDARCPSCQQGTLKKQILEEGLRCDRCTTIVTEEFAAAYWRGHMDGFKKGVSDGKGAKMNPAETIAAFARSVNHFDVNPEGYIRAFIGEHRTLQQSMMGVLLSLIKRMGDLYDSEATVGKYFDGRNDAMGKFCALIVSQLPDDVCSDNYLPPLGNKLPLV